MRAAVPPPDPPLRTLLGRALARRCPACAQGRLFRSFLRLHRACPACGWLIEREPGAVTGPMYVVAILTQLFAALLLGLSWLLVDWSPALLLAVGLPVIALFSLLMLPVAKGMWVALDYITDLRTGEASRPDYARRAYSGGARGGEVPPE